MKTTWLTYRYCRGRAHRTHTSWEVFREVFDVMFALMSSTDDMISRCWVVDWFWACNRVQSYHKVESIFVQTLLVTIVFYLSNAMSGVLCCCSFPSLRYCNTHISYIILLFLDDENLILPRGIIRHQILNNIHNTWQRSATWHDRILKPILANFHTINLLNPRN